MNCLIGFFNGLHRCFSQIDKKVLGIVLFFGLFLNGTVSGATYYLIASTQKWNTAADGSGTEGTPTSDDDVFIVGGADGSNRVSFTLTENLSVKSLSIQRYVEIDVGGKSITVAETFNLGTGRASSVIGDAIIKNGTITAAGFDEADYTNNKLELTDVKFYVTKTLTDNSDRGNTTTISGSNSIFIYPGKNEGSVLVFDTTGTLKEFSTEKNDISEKFVWIGVTDTNWNETSNWAGGTVPTSNDGVLIPKGCEHYPDIKNSDNITVKNLEIVSEAKFSQSGGKVTVSEEFISLENSEVILKELSASDVKCGGTSKLVGNVTAGNEIIFSGDVCFNGDSNLEAVKITFEKPLIKDTADNSSLKITGDAEFKESVSNIGSLEVTGDVVFSGDVKVADSISVSGTTEFSGTVAQKIETSGSQTYTGDVTLSQDVTFLAGTDTVSFEGNVDGTRSLSIGDASNKTNVKFGGAVGSSDVLSDVTLNGNAEISKSINTSGDQTYIGNVSLSGDVTLSSAGGNLNFGGSGKIISGSHKLVVNAGTGTPQTISFNGSFDDAADLKISGNAVIQGSNTFSSLVIDNASFTADTTVSFQGGTGFTQTIGFLSAKAGDSNTVTLDVNSGDKWNADFTAAPGKNNFKNARISNSESTKKIYLSKEDDYINEGILNSTKNWFDVPVTYYWTGTSSSNWKVYTNWEFDDGTGRKPLAAATDWPDFELGTSVIVIDTQTNDLDLGTGILGGAGTVSDIKIKSLKIPDDKRIKIGTCTVSTTEDFIIDGTLALAGTQALNPLSAKAETDSPAWGDNSTIEYYGTGAKDILSVDGNGKFNNLHVSAGDLTVEKKATVKKFTNDTINATETVFEEEAEIADFISSSKGTVTFKKDAAISTSVTNDGEITLTEGLFTAPAGSSLGKVNVVGETSFSDGFTFSELNISSSTSGFSVKFPAGETQTIGKITCKGASAAETITLQSDTDGNRWLVEFGTKPVETDFKYTIVKDSESTDELDLAQIADNIQDATPSDVTTRNWFSQSFYWYGSATEKDGKWTTPGNWKQKPQYSPTTELASVGYPDYSSGTSKIFIMAGSTADDILNLSSDTATDSSIKVESIVVSPLSAPNITVDFGKTSVEVTTTVSNTGITNNGKIRLEGVSSQTITGTMINGTDSTVEYYGADITKLVWDGDSSTDGNQFENIEFAKDSIADLSEKFIVSKNATFLGKLTSAEDNAISGTLDIGSTTVTAGDITLSGANAFGGNIIITDAGDVSFSSENNTYASGKTVTITKAGDVILNGTDAGLTLVSGAECASLNIKCPATLGTVTTSGDQTYEKKLTLSGDSTWTANSGSGTINLGNGTDLIIDGDSHKLSVLGNVVLKSDTKISADELSVGDSSNASTVTGAGKNLTVSATSKATFFGEIGTSSDSIGDFSSTESNCSNEFSKDIWAKSVYIEGKTKFAGTSSQTVTTAGNQTYTGDGILGCDVTLKAGENLVKFGGKLDSESSENNSLHIGDGSNKTKVEFGGNVGSTDRLSSIDVIGETTFGKTGGGDVSVFTAQTQTYTENVTLQQNTKLISGGNITFGTSDGTLGSVTSGGKKLEVSADSGTVITYFYGGFADSADLTLVSNAEIYKNNTFSNFIAGNSSLTFPMTVLFDGNTKQTIDDISTNGTSSNSVTLKSKDSNMWKVNFTGAVDEQNFKYTIVGNSESVDGSDNEKDLGLVQIEEYIQDASPSALTTKCWFTLAYYWFGKSHDNKWTTADNWSQYPVYNPNVSQTSKGYPNYERGDSIIYIKAGDSANDNEILKLDTEPLTEIKVKKIDIPAGLIVDLGNCSVEVTDSDDGITNNGVVRIYGTNDTNNQTITGTMKNGAGSTVEYYGSGVKSLPWDGDSSAGGKQYANIEFGNGFSSADPLSDSITVSEKTLFANGAGKAIELSGNNSFTGVVTLGGTVTSGGSLVQAGNITLSGENAFKDNIIITEAGNVTFSSGSNSYASGKTVTITKAENVILNGNADGLELNPFATGAECASLNIKCPATIGNVTTTGQISGTSLNETQLYEDSVILSADSIFTGAANDLIHFGGTVTGGTHSIESVGSDFRFDDDVTGITDLTSAAKTIFAKTSGTQLISSDGNQTYNGDVEKLNSTSDISLISKNVTVAAEKSVTVEGNISVTTTENFILEGKNPVSATGEMTVTNTGYFLAGKESSITVNKFTQNGTGENQLGCAFVSPLGISFAKETYIYGASSFNSANGNVSFDENVFVCADAGTSAVTFDSPTNVKKNFVLLKGAVTQNADLTVQQDIVLLNNPNYDDNIAPAPSINSGVTNLFTYFNENRKPEKFHAKPSLTEKFADFPTDWKCPDGTTAVPVNDVSSFTIDPGIKISALQNFYANGVDLNPAGAWNLILKDNDNQMNAFAEAYNAKIANCSANFPLAAAENCTDSGNNTKVFFSRPELLKNDQSKERELAGIANFSGTYTVYDDVIRVEFVDSISKASIKIENSNNEISRAIENQAIKYQKDGNLSPFTGAYADANCTVSTDGKGDLAVFFIKTASSPNPDSKWNTDADGQNAFNDSSSTDSNGVHHENTLPIVDIEKSRDDLYESLRDEHKNRINHITGANSFKDTSDRASPALIGVFVGQELHVPYNGSANSQPEYDAHNFIEFMYSEQVEISTGSVNMPIAGTGCVNVTCDSVTGSIPNSTAEISVAGLGSMPGAISAFNKKDGGATPHTLYRTFSLTENLSDAAYQPYRIRVSIAGRVDGTYEVSTGTFHDFVGCIDSATPPSGNVTRFANTTIKDAIGNPLDQKSCDYYNSTGNSEVLVVNKKPKVMENDTALDSSLYGTWDTSAPTYAPYFLDYVDWRSNVDTYEIIGSIYANSTFVENIEFHLFDNTPTYSEPNHWTVKQGWKDSEGTIVSGSPDVAGGSRSFDDPRTSGGIRRSSLLDAEKAFTYQIAGSSGQHSFGSKEITQSVKSLLHVNADQSTTDDSLYFAIPLNEADNRLPTSTIFNIKYDHSVGRITDLAGNRLKEPKIVQSIDVTPPAFVMSLAPTGENFAYFIFTKQLAGKNAAGRLVPIENLNASERAVHFENLVKAFGSSSDLKITKIEYVSSSKPKSYTVLKFFFNKTVSLSDVKTTLFTDNGIEGDLAKNIFGQFNDNTYIFDSLANYLSKGKAHVLSDFAVNTVNVLYAHAFTDVDGDGIDDEGWNEQGVYGTIAPESDDYAVHDFTGKGENYGRLRTKRNINIQAQFVGDKISDNYVKPENNEIAELLPLKKSVLSEDMVSDKINAFLGTEWRLWLPSKLDSLASTPAVVEAGTDGVAAGDDNEILKNFKLDNTSEEKYNWVNGDEIQFIFKIKDSNGNDIIIDHEGDGSSVTPLYSVWLPNLTFPKVPFVDLWSFTLKDFKAQRGGVTILNNVINVNIHEQTVVHVDMPEGGNLSIYVTTVDGNIIKRLAMGHYEEGLHNFKWDGTNRSGDSVARGLYFVRVIAPGIDETRKVICVKE